MKTIDATLLAHKQQPATTLTGLLLVGPDNDGVYRGFTELDQDVVYTPSVAIGAITFRARIGYEMSALQATADVGVDNAEAQQLVPVPGFEAEGFTQEQIDAGVLDRVRFVVLLVNYNDLTSGRAEVIAGGTIGEVRRKHGQITLLELRSLSQQLRQSLLESDSLSCRAKFGSQAIDSSGEGERFPCGFDFTSEWSDGDVVSVGAETDRQFQVLLDSNGDTTDDYYVPGMVEWLTGDNVGQSIEVDAYASSIVDLKFPAVSPIQVGDTFRIRRSCTKRHEGHNSCQTFFSTDWILHFRGEPYIPVANAAAITTPGVGIPGTPPGTGENPGSAQ